MSSRVVSRITGDMLADARKLIGVPLRRELFNTEAARPAIVRFGRGIGERNPLYLSEEYGRGTVWGSMLAPPTWLYSVDTTSVAPGFRGIHALHCGADWTFIRPIRLCDRFTAEARLLDVVEKEGRFCGPMALQVGGVSFRNQRDEVVAVAQSRVMRTPRDAAREKGKYSNTQKYRYSPKELAAIEKAYDTEFIRGEETLYWEDVNVGDRLPPVVKGPLTSEDILSFVNATRPFLAFQRFHSYVERHPAYPIINPGTGLTDTPEASLVDDKVAQTIGFPAAHDTGIQRICWLGSLLTNWMGDSAFLKRLNVEVRLPNIYGDTTWCKGEVTGKQAVEDKRLVEVKAWCENQRGEVTAGGEATVVLMSRDVSTSGNLVP